MTAQLRDIERADSVYCFLLRNLSVNNMHLSRTQFILNSNKLCCLRKGAFKDFKPYLEGLSFKSDLPYNTRELALEWNVANDSTIAVKSITPPVIAMLVVYKKTGKRKSYGKNDMHSIIWVTTNQVEIEDKAYYLNKPLFDFLFLEKNRADLEPVPG